MFQACMYRIMSVRLATESNSHTAPNAPSFEMTNCDITCSHILPPCSLTCAGALQLTCVLRKTTRTTHPHPSPPPPTKRAQPPSRTPNPPLPPPSPPTTPSLSLPTQAFHLNTKIAILILPPPVPRLFPTPQPPCIDTWASPLTPFRIQIAIQILDPAIGGPHQQHVQTACSIPLWL